MSDSRFILFESFAMESDTEFTGYLKKIIEGTCRDKDYFDVIEEYRGNDRKTLIGGAMLRVYLNGLRKNIGEIERLHAANSSYAGSRELSWAYMHKCEISMILNYLKGVIDTVPYELESGALIDKLKFFEKENSKSVEDELFSTLGSSVKTYQRKVDWFANYSADREGEDVLDKRDAMEFLMGVLKNDFGRDVGDMEKTIRAIDVELYNIFVYDIDEIAPGGKEPWYEYPYYPDSFWWRHPSRIYEKVHGAGAKIADKPGEAEKPGP